MRRDWRATRDVTWRVESVPVRARDGPMRVEQAYRILIRDRVTTLPQVIRQEEGPDARGDLCQSVHRATGTPADH